MAYQFAADHATISLNSVCGQYQDQTLDDLSKGVALGLAKPHTTAVQKLEIAGFPALRTTTEGLAGAIPVTVLLTVLRSDRCVYDFLLVARKEQFVQHVPAYASTVAGFRENPTP